MVASEPVRRPDPPLAIAGPVTLAEVARWREALAEELSRGRDLRLDLAESGPWDLAGVQLLLSAHAACGRSGGRMRLFGPPGVFLAVVERAGLGGLISPLYADLANGSDPIDPTVSVSGPASARNPSRPRPTTGPGETHERSGDNP